MPESFQALPCLAPNAAPGGDPIAGRAAGTSKGRERVRNDCRSGHRPESYFPRESASKMYEARSTVSLDFYFG